VVSGGKLRLGENPLLREEVNIHDWWRGASTIETEETKPVWISLQGDTFIENAHLYVFRWKNPHPGRVVESIRIELRDKTESMLGVIGMTARIG